MARSQAKGADPRVETVAGTVWLVFGLVVGALILWAEPFGAPANDPAATSDLVVGNGYVLAVAPLLAIVRAYRQVRAVPFSPRGLEERRQIGGRWMGVTCALHALAPAAVLAWGSHRIAYGLGLTAVVAVSWLVFVETQRRTRVPLAFEDWTSAEIDRLRVNSEFAYIALVWSAAGVALEVAVPSAIPNMGTWIAGVALVGLALAFLRVVAELCSALDPVGFAAILGSCLAVWILVTSSRETWLPVVGSLTLVLVVALERRRRARQLQIAQRLDEAGNHQALVSRYGPEFSAV